MGKEAARVPDRHEYRLKIGAFDVASRPMSRLAEFMSGLARLFGEPEHVHFSHLEPGGAVLQSTVFPLRANAFSARPNAKPPKRQ
jgi:hypothetical protein